MYASVTGTRIRPRMKIGQESYGFPCGVFALGLWRGLRLFYRRLIALAPAVSDLDNHDHGCYVPVYAT